MADKYTDFVSRGWGRDLAKRLGLPQPVALRRYEPGAPLVAGPVLLVGAGAGADALETALKGWDVEVLRDPGVAPAAGGTHDAGASPSSSAPPAAPAGAGRSGAKLGGIVLALDTVARPEDLSGPILAAGRALRSLGPSARVVTVSRRSSTADEPALAAARAGVDGILRSLAKELHSGATGNGILLAEGVEADAPSALGALRFLLSGRSAFVDGQFLTVGTAKGELPADPEKPLAGKVAVVTGAARGIGAAIARTLARDGAKVVVVDVPAAGDSLAKVANEVRGTALQLDITKPEAGERILEHALARHGALDILVHNAGITRDKLLANMDPARWDSVIAVNIAAQLRINEALLGSGRLGDGFRLVSVASTSGIAGNRGQTNYAASKAGVIGMVRSTAARLAASGGSANAVAPGFIETEMTARIPFATREVARRLNSLQQGGLPLDVAEAIAFLASDAAGGISGNVLRVCGQNLVGQ
ncbi:Short-chain dehydrogenase/reductase SDR [Sinomonas atrocyanea]|uniref:Short-chain dehydrogenase/reductase SDR n=2 Tax=Sinomonas atrocyanea TaxID=37927 RepID=A0A126ZZT0_9MICC|nr:3-oxoacyl-ACP reductase [Sinomonas atrocyanea]AMM32689.1 Short-chain dehydrogenase/reductase SDR [Sinomonas atrocyanea]GEB62726.1 3-oxoacyl-ACP reductase [Sinomonas atrocyanea]